MKFIKKSDKIAGILTPVFSLKSKHSEGCGDFYDLVAFAKTLVGTGISLLQLLPLNDSGTDSSPYNSLSACGFSPIYIRLSKLSFLSFLDSKHREQMELKIKNIQSLLNVKYEYKEVYKVKTEFLKELYNLLYNDIISNQDFLKFIEDNEWVKEYAVFKMLKEKNMQKSHFEWQDPVVSLQDVPKFIEENKVACCFYLFMQYEAFLQCKEVSEAINNMGFYLKGDMPILVNEDSSDVYFYPNYFDLKRRIGAVPDLDNPEGQNWGFPSYIWINMELDDYSWWKKRIKFLDNFFHSYRIDHILGFFRVWNIEETNVSGALGFFEPSSYFTKEELNGMGFSEERIVWLSEPHIYIDDLKSDFKSSIDFIKEHFLKQIEGEDLYLFKNHLKEKDIERSSLTRKEKDLLLDYYRNRVFVEFEGRFYKAHFFYNCDRFNYLSDEEKFILSGAFKQKECEDEAIWEEHGKKLLSFIVKESEMLVCGEDLGASPLSTEKVLNLLNILSLKVIRWVRDYDKEGYPFKNLQDYPKNSVCALSIHDTSTFREWWAKEPLKSNGAEVFGIPSLTNYLDEKTMEIVIKNIYKRANSFLVLYSIQDLLNLFKDYSYADERSERINIPGTVSNTNWAYQVPNFDSILEEHFFRDKLKEIFNKE